MKQLIKTLLILALLLLDPPFLFNDDYSSSSEQNKPQSHLVIGAHFLQNTSLSFNAIALKQFISPLSFYEYQRCFSLPKNSAFADFNCLISSHTPSFSFPEVTVLRI